MNRIEIVRFLNLCITEYFASTYRIFFEVSISKTPLITPEGWAEKYHLDCVLLEKQRGSSKNPFRTHCIEIKSCKSDFKSDTKWKNYVGRTDMLSFLALPDVINPKDLPDGIGLMIPRCERSFLYLDTIKRQKSQDISTEARYDTMYGLAINTRRYDRSKWTEKEREELYKLEKKYLNRLNR